MHGKIVGAFLALGAACRHGAPCTTLLQETRCGPWRRTEDVDDERAAVVACGLPVLTIIAEVLPKRNPDLSDNLRLTSASSGLVSIRMTTRALV